MKKRNSNLMIFLILGLSIEQAHTFVPAYRPPQCYPTHEHDKLQASTMMKMSSKSIDRKVDGLKRTSDTKKIPKHDRTIDRRKSPALWRDDLEYSITSGADNNVGDETYVNNKDNFIPKEPPELMSPAGGWSQLKAAVANGADAVYLGLTSYSARARAENFDPDPTLLWRKNRDEADGEYEPIEGKPASLIHAVQFCHKHHVRVYVAFNTLVFDNELHEVQSLIEKVWDCGVDAVIV